MPISTVNARMRFVRETKNKVLYKEVDDQNREVEPRDAQIGQQYIDKKAFPSGPPGIVTVEITVGWED